MPKHLILFVVFMGLLVALFYHPVPDPEIWDADARHIPLPDHQKIQLEKQPKVHKQDIANWSKQIDKVYHKQQKVEARIIQ